MKEEKDSGIDQYYYEGSAGSCYLVIASLCVQSFLHCFFACAGLSQGHLCYKLHQMFTFPFSYIRRNESFFKIVETYFEFQVLNYCSAFPEICGFQLEPWLRRTAVPSLLSGYA